MTIFKIKYLLILALFLSIYFLSRFQNLTSIPVFGDEAIYIRWAQLIKNVETLRFVPLTDGKQPLFMWLTAISLKFISDPLIAGRVISVFSGGLILITIYIICLLFTNFYIALLGLFLYIFSPFTFFFDRLALADNLLSFFGITSLLLSLLLAKYPRLDLSMILGFFVGLGCLTKSPAVYFILLSFITFILYKPKNIKKIYFPLISSAIAFLIFSILRLGPQFHQIALRNQDYVWPLAEIIKHPLDPLLPHIKDVIVISIQYISFPILLISIIGLFLSKNLIHKSKISLILLLWWFLPLITNLAISKVFTARYILFTLPPLLILLSIGIYYFIIGTFKIFSNKYLFVLIIFLSFLTNIYWLYRISILPFYTRLPTTETGYLSDWTSGWGIKEASIFLKDRANMTNVIVGTEGYFGTLPDGLQIYTDGTKQLTIFGVGVNLTKIPDKLIDARNYGDEVYLLINKSRLKLIPGESSKLTLVKSYDKPDKDQLQLFKIY